MNLDTAISELLVQHNCVIVPQFGSFVGNSVSAKIDTLKNKFQPPSKEISFNQNLVKSDGLLVNHVADRSSISYAQAEEQTKIWVDSMKDELNNSKSFKLNQIGRLFIDTENKLRFEPSFDLNYSLNAYGLSTFHVTPIAREVIPEIEAPIVKEVTEEKSKKTTKVIPISTQVVEVKKDTWKRVAIAAALLPFVFYVGWLSFSTELFKGNNFAYADMNPFTEKICPSYKVRGMVGQQKIEGIKSAFNLNTKGNTASFSLFDKSERQYDASKMIIVNLLETGTAKAVNTSVTKPVIEGGIFKFHIIAGCFGVYRNAERLATKLRKKGYNSAIIDKNKGLYRVAFQSYTSEKEAEKALVEIKSSQNKKAWLLER